MTTSTESRQDVYTRITASIVAELARGVRPWVQSWSASHAAGPVSRPLRFNGEPYRGINVLSLWMSAAARGFVAPIWMTYRQAIALGGQVRRGERGSPVVYAQALTKTETDAETGDEVERAIRFLKGYTVFNVEQIDGLPAQYHFLASPRQEGPTTNAHAEAFFAATGASIAHGGSRAYYAPSTDRVVMPPIEAFRDAEAYYAVLAHETTHWTGHASRLSRDFGVRFGSHAYAMEELIAELGAAFLCADLGLALEPRADHASYIANWLDVLQGDSRAVFTAASHAQRAADYLHARTGDTSSTTDHDSGETTHDAEFRTAAATRSRTARDEAACVALGEVAMVGGHTCDDAADAMQSPLQASPYKTLLANRNLTQGASAQIRPYTADALEITVVPMDRIAKHFFVDHTGRPLSERLQDVLHALAPRLRRHFAIRKDDVLMTEILEEAGRRIVEREHAVGPIERLHGFAWVTVRNIANSRLRRGPARLERQTLDAEESDMALAALKSPYGSVEAIEHDVFWQQSLKLLAPEERYVCAYKRLGFSSREIADLRGLSVDSVNTMFFRLKRKLKKAFGLTDTRSTSRKGPTTR